MAKVIKDGYKFLPVTCNICGCVYEHEKGDRIDTVVITQGYGLPMLITRKLTCPCCGEENTLEVEGE